MFNNLFKGKSGKDAAAATSAASTLNFNGSSVSPNDPDVAWDKVKVKCQFDTVDHLTGDTAPPQAPNTVRFVCISDTHSRQAALTVPPGDVLIHAGDITDTGRFSELEKFEAWMAEQPHARKIVIAGNHDTTLHTSFYNNGGGKRFHGKLEDSDACVALMRDSPHFEYLEDQACTVQGLKVWGSPWQPWFCDWAFNLERGAECAKAWDAIPSDTDVLITHGPPLGNGDQCRGGNRAGCVDLLHQVMYRIKPKIHVFGHIHEGYGITSDGTTQYINASVCTSNYRPTQLPIVIDVPVNKE